MATLKFREASPYKSRNESLPQEDSIYKKYDHALEGKTINKNVVFRVALFGVGRAGTIHLNSIINNKRLELLYIVEEDKSKWISIKNYWNLKEEIKFLAGDDVNQVYNDKNVDAIVVTSPTPTHEKIVTKALEHNKAVFCEKPIAEDPDSSLRCFNKALKVKKPILTAFNRRFDPVYSSLRDRVRNGEVGHVNTIKVCSRDSPLPTIDYLRTSGGIFHDCAVHDIDMITWILGEYPTRVAVTASANIPEIAEIGDFDTVAVILTFPSGTVGIIDLCRYSNYGYDQRLEVFGFKGMVKVENEQPLQSIETFYGFNHSSCPIYYSFASRFETGYLKEMEHFIDVLEGKEELKVNYKDVLAVSKIASACEEAARTCKTVEIKWN